MEALEEAVGEDLLLMLRGIHPRTEEKGEAKGQEETVSQEVDREIMIRDIHPGTKLEDRDLTGGEKELLSSLEDEQEPSLEGGEVVRELRQEPGRN